MFGKLAIRLIWPSVVFLLAIHNSIAAEIVRQAGGPSRKVTTDANELVADIHDRMPVILARSDYARWLGEEPDPRDLMRPFPAEPMRMWPISARVNRPENDDPSIVEPIELATDAA